MAKNENNKKNIKGHNDYHNECTNDSVKIQSESACDCVDHSFSKYIPDEYFYNNCECNDCNCETDDNNKFCSCGCMTNPIGFSKIDSFPCKCSNINFFE